ncbi:MAG: hypothetical protein JWN79_253, partial [Gemmatimonadetes bacterium]|nr:hypothetical protein [Gemmatimonadota bacterium]
REWVLCALAPVLCGLCVEAVLPALESLAIMLEE